MISIKKMTADDIDTLYELIIGIAKYHNHEQYILTNKEELLKSAFTKPIKFEAFIATYDGEVAGYVSYTWNYSIWLGGDYMNIDDLFVWDKYRSKKIGEALMLEAKKICEHKNIDRIRWTVQKDNLGAIKFYERLGAEIEIKGICRWHIA